MLRTMSKQGAALSLATAMTPSAAAAASALGAPWRRRQLMQTTRAASTSTTSSSPGPLPGVEPRDATADQAQERVNVQAPQANQHLPDPAAPDAPITATAGLSADAYSSQSPLTQAQPLKAGQATGFYWTLTPRAGANEPIKANVCVIVASGPELICGGAVQPAAPANDNNGRIFGVALLLLIAGVVIGWFVRGRSPPATKTAAKPRSKAPGW